MADADRQVETQAPDEERNDASSEGITEEIVSNHAEHDERFEEEMREYMRHIDARLSQLADAQAAIVSTARIDDNDADEDEHGNDAMDDGVLDLVIND